MLNCKILQLLSINCNTIEADQTRGQENVQSKQGKSQKNPQKPKIKLQLDSKSDQEMD